MFERVAILAPGLLGASVARAARLRGVARGIAVWARRPETRVALAAEPWCDSVHEQPGEAAKGADLVVVCSPVDAIVPLVERVAPYLAPGAIVTDVGSTKSLICRHARFSIGSSRTVFVGSHPMAGSDKTGHEHATDDLFEGAACFVTPLEDDEAGPVDKVCAFWRRLGGVVVTVSPEEHDEIVAHVSHLPHVVAAVLCSLLSRRPEAWARYAGNGLRDTTRIAGGSPLLWKAILTQNRDEVVRALGAMEDALHEVRSHLLNHDDLGLLATLERGQRYRQGLRPAPAPVVPPAKQEPRAAPGPR